MSEEEDNNNDEFSEESAIKRLSLIKQADNYDLGEEIRALLSTEWFFASVSKNLTKRKNRNVPTICVMFNHNRLCYEIHYNPDFMSTLPFYQRQGLLIHEFLHILLGHCSQARKFYSDPSDHIVANVAMDLAVNSYIAELMPEGSPIPGVPPFEEFPKFKSTMWYYNQLRVHKEKLKEMYKPFDDHSGWMGETEKVDPPKDLSGDPCSTGDAESDAKIFEAYAEGIEKDIQGKAYKEAKETGQHHGHFSNKFAGEFIKMMESKLNWRAILRMFIARTQKAESYSSIKKVNKRYPLIHPGRRFRRYANIAVSIDQSGSVSDELLKKFYSELNALSDFVTFTVVPFDHEVFEDKIFVWKRGKTVHPQRVLTGGTNFDAPTKYVNDHNFDGHIILTDMCAPEPIPSKCRRMWITDEHNYNEPYFKPNNELMIPIVD